MLLNKIYSTSDLKFLWINIALASFIALAHGSALAITFNKSTPDASEIKQIALVSLPLAAIIILTSVAALTYVQLKPKVLALHGIVLSVGAGILYIWALNVLLNGVPEGRFTWTPGFMTAAVCYSIVLFCRFSMPLHLRKSWAIFYAPLFGFICAVPVDLGVFLRVVG